MNQNEPDQIIEKVYSGEIDDNVRGQSQDRDGAVGSALDAEETEKLEQNQLADGNSNDADCGFRDAFEEADVKGKIGESQIIFQDVKN